MNKIEVKTLEITPEMAAEMLSRNVGNRPINKNTVSSYADFILNDEWQLTPEGISFNQYNELINGQHRLSAIVKANKSVMMMVFYNVPQENFKVIDTGKSRTGRDVFAIEGIKNAAVVSAGLKKYYIYSNSNEIHANKYNKKVSNTVLLDLYYANANLIDEVVKVCKAYYLKAAFYSQSDLIGIILYLNYDKGYSLSEIQGFFNQLIHGRFINSNCITKLRDRLVQSGQLASKRLYPFEKLILLKKVWNAYFGKSDLKHFNTDYDKKEGLDFL